MLSRLALIMINFIMPVLTKPVLAEKQKIKKHILDQKLIFSVDRLDYSKGFAFKT